MSIRRGKYIINDITGEIVGFVPGYLEKEDEPDDNPFLTNILGEVVGFVPGYLNDTKKKRKQRWKCNHCGSKFNKQIEECVNCGGKEVVKI